MNLKDITLSEKKKSFPKGYMLYDSMYIKFLKWQNLEPEGRLVAGSS